MVYLIILHCAFISFRKITLIPYCAILRYSRVGGQNWGNLVHVVVEYHLGYYQWRGFHLGLS